MSDSRYIKKTKRYRDHGLNQHHRDGSSSDPKGVVHTTEPGAARPKQEPRADFKEKKGGSITARLAVQLCALSVVAGFYINLFKGFSVFTAIPAIYFLTFWGKLLQRASPNKSPGYLAFESGVLMLLFGWIFRLSEISPAFHYPLILFDPVELGYRMGDLWAEAHPLTLFAWILEIILLTMAPAIRIQRAKKSQSDYNPFQ